MWPFRCACCLWLFPWFAEAKETFDGKPLCLSCAKMMLDAMD